MVSRRVRFPKRRVIRRKNLKGGIVVRSMGSGASKSLISRVPKIHYFKRTFVDSVALSDSFFLAPVGSLGMTNSFTIDQLPNVTDFTSLYEEYKLCGIKRKFVYDRNSAESSATGGIIPNLVTVNDWRDGSDLGSENAALEYKSFKVSRLDKPVSRYYKPAIAVGEANGGTGNNFIKFGAWLTTAQTDSPHFGLKWGITTNANTTVIHIGDLKVYTTVYLACRNPK